MIGAGSIFLLIFKGIKPHEVHIRLIYFFALIMYIGLVKHSAINNYPMEDRRWRSVEGDPQSV